MSLPDAPGPGGLTTTKGKVAVLVAALAFGVLVSVGVTTLYDRYGQADASAQITTYTVLSDDEVRMSFTVSKEPSLAGACLVRSRSEDLGEAGHDVVPIPRGTDGGRVVAVEHVLRTTKRAVTAEIVRCKTLEPGEPLPAHAVPAAPGQPHH